MSSIKRHPSDPLFARRRQKDAFQDVKLCNCAACNIELAAPADARYYGLKLMFGRLGGRPFCEHCFRERQVKHDGTTNRRDRSPQRHIVKARTRLDADRTGKKAQASRPVAEPTGEGPRGPDSPDAC